MTEKKMQSRGRQRRRELLETARALLKEREMQKLTLPDIASAAGIPRASAYHFFADVQDVFHAVAEAVEAELLAYQEAVAKVEASDWRQIVAAYVRSGAEFFRQNYDAAQLLIGPHTPAIVKLSDRKSDVLLANQLLGMVSDRFVIPEINDPEGKIYHAIEIADLFFCLSVMRCGEISDEYENEAVSASIAYLSIYIPPVLMSLSRPT